MRAWQRMPLSLHLVWHEGDWFQVCLFLLPVLRLWLLLRLRLLLLLLQGLCLFYRESVGNSVSKNVMPSIVLAKSHHEKRIKWRQCCLIVCVFDVHRKAFRLSSFHNTFCIVCTLYHAVVDQISQQSQNTGVRNIDYGVYGRHNG